MASSIAEPNLAKIGKNSARFKSRPNIFADHNRVPALHILFIGGFSLLAFGVATHVALGHLNMGQLALGRPPAVIVLGAAFMVALLARLAADASDTYFSHLGWAAAVWILGSAVWLIFFGPKLLMRS